MKKRVCYTEAAYLFGILWVALGVALMERADFGVSMVAVSYTHLSGLEVGQGLLPGGLALVAVDGGGGDPGLHQVPGHQMCIRDRGTPMGIRR